MSTLLSLEFIAGFGGGLMLGVVGGVLLMMYGVTKVADKPTGHLDH